MKFIKYGLLFWVCFVLVACGQSEIDKTKVVAVHEFPALDVSKLPPCQRANNCAPFAQMQKEQMAMDLKNTEKK